MRLAILDLKLTSRRLDTIPQQRQALASDAIIGVIGDDSRAGIHYADLNAPASDLGIQNLTEAMGMTKRIVQALLSKPIEAAF